MNKRILLIFLVALQVGCTVSPNSNTSNAPIPSVSPVSPSELVSATPTVSPISSATPSPKPKETDSALDKQYQAAYNQFHGSKYSEAIKTADLVLKNDPRHYKSLNIKGIALCFSDKFTAGMKCIDAALEIAPDFGYALFNKALAYEYNGQLDEAIVWYDKALQVENYVWSHYGKASVYGRRGDVLNTVKNLKIAIDLDPVVKQIAKEEKDFNPVKKSKEFIEITR